MKIKKLIVFILSLVACLFAIVCMTGCGKSYTVTVIGIENPDGFKLNVKAGDTVTMEKVYEEYHDYFLKATGCSNDYNLYTDKTHITKFVGGVYQDITLYYGRYCPTVYGKIVFDYAGEQYVIFRAHGATLAPIDFSRSAYGYGEPTDYVFYSDEERTVPLNITDVEIGEYPHEITIYVADAE